MYSGVMTYIVVLRKNRKGSQLLLSANVPCAGCFLYIVSLHIVSCNLNNCKRNLADEIMKAEKD